MNNELPEIFKTKRKSMYLTKKCRFLESWRLSIKNKISLLIRTSLTISIMGISIFILSYGDNIGQINKKLYTCVSLISSISLLVLSFYDSSLNRQGKTEKFHKNGTDISVISAEYEIEISKKNPDLDALANIIKKYELFISSSDLNHSPSTYNLVRAKESKAIFISCIVYNFRSFFEYFFSMIAYIIPATFVIILVFVNFFIMN